MSSVGRCNCRRAFIEYMRAAESARRDEIQLAGAIRIAQKQLEIAQLEERNARDNVSQAQYQATLVERSIEAKAAEIADAGSFTGQLKAYFNVEFGRRLHSVAMKSTVDAREA